MKKYDMPSAYRIGFGHPHSQCYSLLRFTRRMYEGVSKRFEPQAFSPFR